MIADFARGKIYRNGLCCESSLAQLAQDHSLETSRVGGSRVGTDKNSPGTGPPLPLLSAATAGVSCQLEQDVIAHALSITVTTYEKEARRQAEAANWSLLR